MKLFAKIWRKFTGPKCPLCKTRGIVPRKYGLCLPCYARFEADIALRPATQPVFDEARTQKARAKAHLECESMAAPAKKNGSDKASMANATVPPEEKVFNPSTERWL